MYVSLTVTVDTLYLWVLGSRSTYFVIVRHTLLQLHQQPFVATGLLTGNCLCQVGAISCATCGLIHDFPFPQFETCRRTQMRLKVIITFTFMHLADAFIQSDLQCIQAIRIFYQYVCFLGIEPTTFCAANAMLYH